MNDWDRTKEQLIDELVQLRQTISGLKASVVEDKQLEEVLRYSEETYRSLVDNSLVGINKSTVGGKTLYVNEALVTMFEYDSPGEMMQHAVPDFYKNPKDREVFIEKLKERGQVSNYELEVVTKTGKTRDIVINANLDGEIISGMIMDITESKRMEETILQSKILWENTFDTITDYITIHDRDFNILRANKTAKRVLGLPDLEIFLDIKCYKYYHGTDSPLEKCVGLECQKTERPCTLEIFEPHLNRFLEIMAIPRLDSNNQLIGLIHVGRDVTERRNAMETIQIQLRRLNILRSIDRAINASLDLHVTLDILLEQVTAQLNIDAATVLLLNQRTQILEYVVSRGFRSSALKYTKLKLGESNAGRAAIERRIVTIPNLKEDVNGFVRSKPFADEDFIAYFAVPLVAKGQVKGVLELFHRSHLDVDPEWLEFLEAIAGQAAIAIDNATLFDGLQRSNIELTLAYDTTIEGWSRALDMRDKKTEGHTLRVTDIALRVAQELRVKDEELVHIRRGSLLHDIGKMGIPDNILLKPGPLTEEEWGIMKKHPVYAYEMLYPIEYLRSALDIPYCHHEKWDGTGYPRGLKGEEIPLAARIFAVVDVWDALNSDRPYRPAWQKEKVLEHIRSLSGTHFDPQVVELFLKIKC